MLRVPGICSAVPLPVASQLPVYSYLLLPPKLGSSIVLACCGSSLPQATLAVSVPVLTDD